MWPLPLASEACWGQSRPGSGWVVGAVGKALQTEGCVIQFRCVLSGKADTWESVLGLQGFLAQPSLALTAYLPVRHYCKS